MRGIRGVWAASLVAAGALAPSAAASPPPYPFLYVSDADGGGTNPLADYVAEYWSSIDWSPDGTKIAFPSAGRIYTAQADGSEEVVAVTEDSDAQDFHPDWSPDGTKIAFARGGYQVGDVYVTGLDGGGSTALTSGPEVESWPVWSPDGGRIAFYRTVPGSESVQLVVTGSDGSSPRVVSDGDVAPYFPPRWSPDGGRLAITKAGPESSEIVVVSADGSGESSITPPGGRDRDPEWSPDGTRLAFASREAIVVADATGGGNRMTLYPKGFDPSWSPNGTRIAFSDGYDVMTIAPDGSDPEEVAVFTYTLTIQVAWSPDGGAIAHLGNFLDGRDHCAGIERDTTKAFGSGGALVAGTEGDDGLEGSEGNDVVCGYDGSDEVAAGPGRDEIFAGGGGDTIAGGADGDWIEGDGTGWRGEYIRPGGDDTISGGTGGDHLFGGRGDDVLRGGHGEDLLRGGGGRDVCIPGEGEDDLRGCEIVR